MGFGQSTVVVNQGTASGQIPRQPVFPIGNNAYTFIDAHHGWIVSTSPQTRKPINLKKTGTSAGSSVKIDNGGVAPMDLVLEAGVSVFPVGVKSVPAGTSATIECLLPGQYWVDVARRSQVQLGAPVREDIDPVISLVGATFSLDFAGAWLGDIASYQLQWTRDGVDIAGETAVTKAKVVGDDGTTIACKVRATDKLARQSAAPATSNGIAVPAVPSTGAPVFTRQPRILLSGGAVPGSSVEVGQVLQADSGDATGSPTYTYRWLNPPPGGGTPAVHGTGSTYTVGSGGNETNETLFLEVTATNATAPAAIASTSPLSVVAAGTGGGTPPPATDLAGLLVSDMRSFASGKPLAGQGLFYGGYRSDAASEAQPAGNWSGDWMFNPRAKSNSIRSGNARYIQPAGGVYEITGRNNTLCKVEVMSIQGWVRYDDGTWIRLIYRAGVSGFSNLYPEDWGTAAPGNGAKTVTVSAATGGGTLCLLGPSSGPNNLVTSNGLHHLFHVWSGLGDARGSLTGGRSYTTISGVAAAIRMRLDPLTYDANAKYIGYVGCDAYDASASPKWYSDLGIGRMKKVDDQWRLYTCCTAPTSGGLPSFTDVSAPEIR